MSTLTVFSGTGDGYVESSSATYATARGGTGSFFVDSTFGFVACGQQLSAGTYTLDEAFLGFDTSTLGSTATISAVTLSLWGNSDNSATDFTLEARLDDWSAGGVTSADWIAGASLSGKTRLATLSTVGFSTTGYNAFTEDGTNFQSNVNKTGTTYLLLASDRLAAGTAPAGAEYVTLISADNAGTTSDPKLTVTYTVPATGYTNLPLLGVG